MREAELGGVLLVPADIFCCFPAGGEEMLAGGGGGRTLYPPADEQFGREIKIECLGHWRTTHVCVPGEWSTIYLSEVYLESTTCTCPDPSKCEQRSGAPTSPASLRRGTDFLPGQHSTVCASIKALYTVQFTCHH